MTDHLLYNKFSEGLCVVSYELERWTTECVGNRLSYQAQKLVVKGSKSNLAANHKQHLLGVELGQTLFSTE